MGMGWVAGVLDDRGPIEQIEACTPSGDKGSEGRARPDALGKRRGERRGLAEIQFLRAVGLMEPAAQGARSRPLASRWPRILRMALASRMKAIMRIGAPQRAQVKGSVS